MLFCGRNERETQREYMLKIISLIQYLVVYYLVVQYLVCAVRVAWRIPALLKLEYCMHECWCCQSFSKPTNDMPLNTHVLAYSLFIFISTRSLYTFVCFNCFAFATCLLPSISPFLLPHTVKLYQSICPYMHIISFSLSLSATHKYEAVCTVSHKRHTHTQHFWKRIKVSHRRPSLIS